MSDMKLRTGGCHCGAVRYEVETDLAQLIACNCSICARTGSILTFVPESQFSLKSGEGMLKDYTFNKHVIHHLFCGTCGIRSFARGALPDGTPMIAVNVRCLDDVDVFALKPVEYDGKSV